MSANQLRAIKLALAIGGLLGLHLILRDFGYARIRSDIAGLGWNFLPVVLCFLFPYILLTFAWRVLIVDSRAPFPFLFLVSLVANAWNNIGPVSKSLGEPTRVLLLSNVMTIREAVKGMMLFNITQAMGTALTFGLAAAVAPLFYDLSDGAFAITAASAIVSLLINFLAIYWVLRRPQGRRPPTKGRKFRAFVHWMRWISHKIRSYARTYPGRYFGSIAFTSMARLSEGAVFYAIFSALGNPLSIWDSIAVDVGRGIADNAFFFVPYQLGTRELSLLFVTESVLHRGGESAVAASLVFRLGEIVWIAAGFLLGLWMLRRRPLK